MNTITIGTRGSKLALWQANYIAEKLLKGGWNTKVVTIDTKGDKILDVSLSKIGSKGVFTEEIEQQLREDKIDIAVHSAKDLQSTLPEDLEIIAFTDREDSSDVLVSYKKCSLRDSITVGTSSTRRVGLLKHYYPNIEIVPMRGNLQTRFSKMMDEHCDAMILAAAGVKRMGFENLIVEYLDKSVFIPPTGQGAVAVEAKKNLNIKIRDAVNNLVNNSESDLVVSCERIFLKILNGGCSIPVFAHAVLDEDEISLTGGICSLDGTKLIMESEKVPKSKYKELATTIAERVLSLGGNKILEQIKKEI